MITPGEIGRSIFGAWILARLNPSGLNFFDDTVDGFWRSFWAAAIVLPAYAFLLTLRNSGVTIGVGAGTAFFVNSIAYVIDWMAFPFLMFYVAQMFNRDPWYCRYIAAYNWSVVLQMMLMLIVGLIAVSGIFPPVVGGWATAIALIFILVYKGFIAHVALQATWAGAAGIVFIDFCLSLVLEGWSAKLLHLQRIVSG
jgi:hypothetical protein